MKTCLFLGLIAALGGSAAIAADPVKVDRKSPDYVRCIKTPETGSIVKKVKLCRTNAEWRKIYEAQTKEADDVIMRTRTLPSGQ